MIQFTNINQLKTKQNQNQSKQNHPNQSKSTTSTTSPTKEPTAAAATLHSSCIGQVDSQRIGTLEALHVWRERNRSQHTTTVPQLPQKHLKNIPKHQNFPTSASQSFTTSRFKIKINSKLISLKLLNEDFSHSADSYAASVVVVVALCKKVAASLGAAAAGMMLWDLLWFRMLGAPFTINSCLTFMADYDWLMIHGEELDG